MRVLFVAPSLDIVGGQSIQADLVMQRLRETSRVAVDFVPINPRLPGPFRSVQSYRFVRTGPTFLYYVFNLFRAIRRCDLLHVFSASYLSFVLAPTPAILMGRLFGKKVLLNYHSGEADDHLSRWKSAVALLRRVDLIVVPSDYLTSIFAKFGLEATVVNNVVDLTAFRYRPRVPLQPRFLVNRNLETHYNVACVLRAYQMLEARLPSALLTVAGEGPEGEALRALAAALRLRNVFFTGRITPSDMPRLYDGHDVFLNASDVDNMPLSILEAYACGLPVVSTDAGGIPFIVQSGTTGLLVPRGQHEALAQAALRLFAEPDLGPGLVAGGRSICERYTWENVGPAWLGAYEGLVGPSAPSRDQRNAGSKRGSSVSVERGTGGQ
ncbi:MAG: glycosyltransferase family 4 protein [Vicinamibacterales bacterium]